jgi:hypothetical protein
VRTVFIRKTLVVCISVIMVTLLTGFEWPQFNGNASHSGYDSQESIITHTNVASLQLLFAVSLPDATDGPPVYLGMASTISGTKSVLFVTTKAGAIVALDASSGQRIWSRSNPAGGCKINNGSSPCYTTSSPAIDPNGRFVYSYGLDGFVHKYRVGDGTETVGSGWPETATLKAFDEKGSAPLAVATARNGTSYLYVTNSGYPGDGGDYQGHLTAINLATGAQTVFNTLCSNLTVHFVITPGAPDCAAVQSGVWSRSSVVYDADNDRIYISTGNAMYDPVQHDWGDTVLALHPNGTGNAGGPVDSYTPSNYQALQNGDIDLGSTNIAVLPVFPTSTVQHLAVQGGKDAMLRLLNLDNLSGQGVPGNTGGEVGSLINVPQGGEVLTAPAVWVNPADASTWVFVANGSGISGMRVTYTANHTPTLSVRWQRPDGGTSPVVANGIVFYASGGIIRAIDATTGSGSGQLWQSTQIGGIHWQSPIVANGVVYIADTSGKLSAFSINGLPPAMFSVFVPVVLR